MTEPDPPGSPASAFDPIIHPTHRLRICAALEPWDDYEFSDLRKVVGVSDSVLSKHVRTLEEAGYVEIGKSTIASRVRTRLSLTKAGRAAFAAHVAELQRITGAPAAAPQARARTAAS